MVKMSGTGQTISRMRRRRRGDISTTAEIPEEIIASHLIDDNVRLYLLDGVYYNIGEDGRLMRLPKATRLQKATAIRLEGDVEQGISEEIERRLMNGRGMCGGIINPNILQGQPPQIVRRGIDLDNLINMFDLDTLRMIRDLIRNEPQIEGIELNTPIVLGQNILLFTPQQVRALMSRLQQFETPRVSQRKRMS
jgi:hypothetical protein